MCLVCLSGSVQAKAAGTNVVTAAKKVSGGSWESTSQGVKYQYANGKYAKNVWLNIGGSIYRIGSDGYRDTGWITYQNKSYYAGSNGRLYVKRWLTRDGKKYYFQASGVCAKYKWLKLNGKYYFFLKSGKMATSRMITTNGKTYYVNSSGVRVKSTWVTKNGKKYYFNSSGVRLRNKWVKSDGKYYYLGSDGVMVTNKWVGSYYVGADGARLTNCVKDGYYLNASGKKVIKVFKGDYIFVGDSRTVGMNNAISPSNTLYIAKKSMGYSWLKSTGGVTLRYHLKLNPDVKVILALGVNDMGNLQSYITYYRKLMSDFPNTQFYVLSVNPVDESKYNGYAKNTVITSFNQKLKAAFPSNYLDTYQYLKTKGFSTVDGLHYTSSTYRKLYKYIIGKL